MSAPHESLGIDRQSVRQPVPVIDFDKYSPVFCGARIDLVVKSEDRTDARVREVHGFVVRAPAHSVADNHF